MIIFINIYIYIINYGRARLRRCGDFGWYQTLADALSRVLRPL